MATEGPLFYTPEELFREKMGADALNSEHRDFIHHIFWGPTPLEVLVVVRDPNHARYTQVGHLMGVLPAELVASFGDTVIETMSEDQLLLIKKTRLTAEAGIGVRLLDEDWQNAIEEGVLIGYERNVSPPSRGSYLARINDDLRRIPDLGGFMGGKIRFSLINPETLPMLDSNSSTQL